MNWLKGRLAIARAIHLDLAHQPEYYAQTLRQYVLPGDKWLDVGCGKSICWAMPAEEHKIAGVIITGIEHFHSRYIVNTAMAEPGPSVVRGDARESLRNCLFQCLGGSGLQRT
jgi:hypothetical protein